jgi:hypothetical protein
MMYHGNFKDIPELEKYVAIHEGDSEYGTYAIALALLAVAQAIRDLGNADAATRMGAIEAHSKLMGEKLDKLTAAIKAK